MKKLGLFLLMLLLAVPVTADVEYWALMYVPVHADVADEVAAELLEITNVNTSVRHPTGDLTAPRWAKFIDSIDRVFLDGGTQPDIRDVLDAEETGAEPGATVAEEVARRYITLHLERRLTQLRTWATRHMNEYAPCITQGDPDCYHLVIQLGVADGLTGPEKQKLHAAIIAHRAMLEVMQAP